MAQVKHSVSTHDEAAEVFATARRNRKGEIVLANNTVLREVPGDDGETHYAVRLHDTNIVTYTEDGRIILNSGGFYSKTTADRMNKFTPFAVLINRRKGDFVVTLRVAGSLIEAGTFPRTFTIL